MKTQDLKESDKLVWIFTEKLGKVTTVAKGAKKSKSKFLSVTLPFCYGNYVMFRGKGMYNISEGEIINSFQGFLDDLESITYASYLCELIDIAMVEDESNRELFKTFISAFYLMSNKAIDYELLARAFEVKLLEATGYGLNLENCSVCKKKIAVSNYISYHYNGGVCSECEKVNGQFIHPAAYSALKFLTKTDIEKVYRLSLSDEVKRELYIVLSNFICSYFSRTPKSLEIFNYLKKE